ncbi:unnamed protein product, partial [Mesorhabditis spiculigera]
MFWLFYPGILLLMVVLCGKKKDAVPSIKERAYGASVMEETILTAESRDSKQSGQSRSKGSKQSTGKSNEKR